MTAQRLFIFFSNNKATWHIKEVNTASFIAGRTPECNLFIPDPEMSRKHFQLDIREESVFCLDLGSANGTTVQDAPLQPRKRTLLLPGQVIQAGSYYFKTEWIGDSGLDEVDSPVETIGLETIIRSNPFEADLDSTHQFQYREGNGHWKEQTIGVGEYIFGRSDDCQIQIVSNFISRHHAKIIVTLEKVQIVDLRSKNGIMINGQSIPVNQECDLDNGNVFTVHPFSFRILAIPKQVAENEPLTLLVPRKPSTEMESGVVQIETALGSIPHGWMKKGPRQLSLASYEKVSIGRDESNEIVLDHPLVSRFHAVIERIGSRYKLVDLHSSNGVYVNNEAVKGVVWLKINDQIKIGPHNFIFNGSEMSLSNEEGYAITVEHLMKQVSKKTNLLKDISFHINSCEFVAVIGMSGAGKTTLVDAINGFRPATSGRVLINGTDLYEHYDQFRYDIGYVPQKDIVHTELTPEIALDYAAQLRMPMDATVKERAAVIERTLKEIGLSERKSLPISKLSGGQIKRVSIGVELLTRPPLFFLDEPTSGLDPNTEYEMMKLLRRLADQGRTILIITHATKNVMLCDKVIILTTGGYLAFYGPPEEALAYFGPYRTPVEQREKEMEFDDIYRILDNAVRGTPAEWRDRFEEWKSIPKNQPPESRPSAFAEVCGQRQKATSKNKRRTVSTLKQLEILSRRNLTILLQDKLSLAMMVLLAPILGAMNFIWGQKLFDPVEGDAVKIMAMWFMTAIMAILIGALCSVREIVKEIEVFRRERAVGLGIGPYIFSKIWVGVVLAFYQAMVMVLFIKYLVHPSVPAPSSYFFLFLTIVLEILYGYLLGLTISAAAPNQNFALIVLIVVIVPQFLFAGVLLPLKSIPLGEQISFFIPTRWTFEAFVNITGIGDPLVKDVCWVLAREQRNRLTMDEKEEKCTCMGPKLFVSCGKFPGVLSQDYYDGEAKLAFQAIKPSKPLEPTRLPTVLPLPTPTAVPSPQSLPTPELFSDPIKNAENQKVYLQNQQAQVEKYQNKLSEQSKEYAKQQEDQLTSYVDAVSNQYSDYAEEMSSFGDALAEWQKKRQKAVGGAEAILSTVYDDYGNAFRGSVYSRWVYLGVNVILLGILILGFQKRKDQAQ